MNLRTIAIAATVLLLTGCSAPAAEVSAPTPSAAVTRSPAPTIAPSPTRTPTPTPTPTATVAVTPPVYTGPTYEEEIFLAALGTLDPGLSHERSLGRAENTCMDIENGMDDAALLSRIEQRFEGGTVPSLSAGQLETMLELIRTTCG